MGAGRGALLQVEWREGGGEGGDTTRWCLLLPGGVCYCQEKSATARWCLILPGCSLCDHLLLHLCLPPPPPSFTRCQDVRIQDPASVFESPGWARQPDSESGPDPCPPLPRVLEPYYPSPLLARMLSHRWPGDPSNTVTVPSHRGAMKAVGPDPGPNPGPDPDPDPDSDPRDTLATPAAAAAAATPSSGPVLLPLVAVQPSLDDYCACLLAVAGAGGPVTQSAYVKVSAGRPGKKVMHCRLQS